MTYKLIKNFRICHGDSRKIRSILRRRNLQWDMLDVLFKISLCLHSSKLSTYYIVSLLGVTQNSTYKTGTRLVSDFVS